MRCQSTTFTAELCLNVDFSLGELDRIHSPSLYYSELFLAKICLCGEKKAITLLSVTTSFVQL